MHVPFCRARCDYCEFYSLPVGEAVDVPAGESAGAAVGGSAGVSVGARSLAALLDRYVEALLAEWRAEAARLSVRRLETVFIGGGTPSLLGPERLDRLLTVLEPLLTAHAEVTVETNPEDVDEAFAAWAVARGIRISLGVQSFQSAQRVALGRHAASAGATVDPAGCAAVADPAAAFARLRAAGVANLSVDLIFAIPGQNEADLEADLAAVAALRPDHVSWYELGVVAGTALAERLGGEVEGKAGRPAGGAGVAAGAGDAAANEAEADRQAELYRRVVRGLGRLGYDWYEVSNFALPGRRARHNLAYWRGRAYLGLGPSAVSTVGGERWRNLPDAKAYMDALVPASAVVVPASAAAAPAPPDTSSAPASPREHEHLDQAALARERLLLAARIGARVPLAELEPYIDSSSLAALAASGYISLRGGTLLVTRKGRYVATAVCVRLFRDTCL